MSLSPYTKAFLSGYAKGALKGFAAVAIPTAVVLTPWWVRVNRSVKTEYQKAEKRVIANTYSANEKEADFYAGQE